MIFELLGLPAVGKTTLTRRIGAATGCKQIYVEEFNFLLRLLAILEMPSIVYYLLILRISVFRLCLYGLCLRITYRRARRARTPLIIDQGIAQYEASVLNNGLSDIAAIKSILSDCHFRGVSVIYINDGPNRAFASSKFRETYTSFRADGLADYARFNKSIKEVIASNSLDFKIYYYRNFSSLVYFINSSIAALE